MLERASGHDRAGLVPRLEERVPARVEAFVQGMVERRRTGEPIQYVLGVWDFRRLELVVDRRVLIPRPETELVVEVALDGVQASTRYPGGIALRFARVRRYRPDKTAAEADTIETVRSLLRRDEGAVGAAGGVS